LPNLSSAKNVSCVDVDKHCAGEEFLFLTTMHTPNAKGVPLVADAVWSKVGTRVSAKATQSIGGLEKCC